MQGRPQWCGSRVEQDAAELVDERESRAPHAAVARADQGAAAHARARGVHRAQEEDQAGNNSERSWQEQGFEHVLTVPASEEIAASYTIVIGVPGGGTSMLLAEFPDCLDKAQNKARRHVKRAVDMFVTVRLVRSNSAVALARPHQSPRAPRPRAVRRVALRRSG